MKLTNPTDDQLNAAFAEHVAGLDIKTPRTWLSGDCVTWVTALPNVPEFTKHADAVLPWLEKQRVITVNWIKSDNENSGWRVDIYDSIESASNNRGVGALDRELPRAAVIALLRANGVEVELSQG